MAINKEIDLRFVIGYTPREFRETLHMLADGKVDACAAGHRARSGWTASTSAFTALGDPEAHAKILIDPKSESGRAGQSLARRMARLAPLSGLAFVVLFGVGSAIWGFDQPDRDAGTEELVAFYADSSTEILIGGSLSLVSIPFLVWFGAVLRDRLAAAEGAKPSGFRCSPSPARSCSPRSGSAPRRSTWRAR